MNPYVPKKFQRVFEIAEQFPYITRLENPTWCDGWVSVKGRPRKCAEPAHWKYKAGDTKKPHAKSGIWCWHHLISNGIQKTKYDTQRAQRAEKKVTNV